MFNSYVINYQRLFGSTGIVFSCLKRSTRLLAMTIWCVCRMVLKCPSNYKQLKTGHVPLVVERFASCPRVPAECYHVVFISWPIEHHHTTSKHHVQQPSKQDGTSAKPRLRKSSMELPNCFSCTISGQAPDSSTYRAAGTCARASRAVLKVDIPGRPKWHIQEINISPVGCVFLDIAYLKPLCRTSRVACCEFGMWTLYLVFGQQIIIDHATYDNS